MGGWGMGGWVNMVTGLDIVIDVSLYEFIRVYAWIVGVCESLWEFVSFSIIAPGLLSFLHMW